MNDNIVSNVQIILKHYIDSEVAIRTKRFDDEFRKKSIKRLGNSYIITRIAMINVFGLPKE